MECMRLRIRIAYARSIAVFGATIANAVKTTGNLCALNIIILFTLEALRAQRLGASEHILIGRVRRRKCGHRKLRNFNRAQPLVIWR